MPRKKFPHIFLNNSAETEAFTSPSSRGAINIPKRTNRKAHAKRLLEQLDQVWEKAENLSKEQSSISLTVKEGVYIEVKGKENYDLITKSLEYMGPQNPKEKIRLCNIRENNHTIIATVFIPIAMRNYFLKKIKEYAEEETAKGSPRHNNLIAGIENIASAVLDSFWTDEKKLIPTNDKRWCEVWLRSGLSDLDFQETADNFHGLCESLNIETKRQVLYFPEKVISTAYADENDLTLLIDYCSDLAEFRLMKETAYPFMQFDYKEQSRWVGNLLNRLDTSENSGVVVCILDTGINNEHDLLSPLLPDKDRFSYEPDWGVEDRGANEGHGTMMAGISGYGDLQTHIESDLPVPVLHRLESVKILHPAGKQHPPDLYGEVVKQSVSRVEIENPEKKRIICMAVTSEDGREKGEPTSWSAAIDALSSGAENDQKRLVILASGNNNKNATNWKNYPDELITNSVHDPGQSWNALTIGAYTEKVRLTEPNLKDYTPVASSGGLSPFTTTSSSWSNKWPIKPEIVFEGGNAAVDDSGFVTTCDDFSILSTNHKPSEKQFALFNATSAASAQAAWFAARLQSRYPQAWPETIRAIMVHSAGWTKEMEKLFLTGKQSKDYLYLLKTCGYGVPNMDMAIESTNNSLTLIAQEEIQPYTKLKSQYKTKDMHFYELPWPKEELMKLGEQSVTLKITLSYFVEPGPGNIGWKDRYRYPSHSLRFDVNRQGEEKNDFKKRLNTQARDGDETYQNETDPHNWLIGPKIRNHGSIHSDKLTKTATDLSTINLLGVYPVIGWWRERHYLKKWNRKTRYSLIISLEVPDIETDIYTPVVSQMGIPTEIN